MTGNNEPTLQRLRWQCRRGLLELDCVFADYLDNAYTSANEGEQNAFQALLNEQDPDLQAWILNGVPAPEGFQAIVRKLRRE